VTLAEALRRYGRMSAPFRPEPIRPQEVAALSRVQSSRGRRCAVEARVTLGVVTGIVGQSRLRVAVIGEAGHCRPPSHEHTDAMRSPAPPS